MHRRNDWAAPTSAPRAPTYDHSASQPPQNVRGSLSPDGVVDDLSGAWTKTAGSLRTWVSAQQRATRDCRFIPERRCRTRSIEHATITRESRQDCGNTLYALAPIPDLVAVDLFPNSRNALSRPKERAANGRPTPSRRERGPTGSGVVRASTGRTRSPHLR